MPKTVTARIPLEGISTGARSVQFETDGFTGESCRSATEAFERAIGAQTDEELKSEFFETERGQEFLTDGGDE